MISHSLSIRYESTMQQLFVLNHALASIAPHMPQVHRGSHIYESIQVAFQLERCLDGEGTASGWP